MKPRNRQSWANLKARYGVTETEYMAQLDRQGGVCAVCEGKRPYWLHVDHRHDTGQVRGLVCKRCNRLLRDVRDNVTLLWDAAEYVLHPPWPTSPHTEPMEPSP